MKKAFLTPLNSSIPSKKRPKCCVCVYEGVAVVGPNRIRKFFCHHNKRFFFSSQNHFWGGGGGDEDDGGGKTTSKGALSCLGGW